MSAGYFAHPAAAAVGDDEPALAIAASGAGYWRWELATGNLTLSAPARAMLGASSASTRSFSEFIELIDRRDRGPASAAIEIAMTTLGYVETDFRTSSKSASAEWIGLRGHVFGGYAGVLGARGLVLDLGRYKLAAEANSRLAAIVTSSRDAIIGKNLDGAVTDWNQGAQAIFGYTASEMIGRTLAVLVPDGQMDETFLILDRIRQGERVAHYETTRRCKNGRVIDVSLTVSPVWSDDGQLLGASKVARDITVSKRNQRAAMERETHLQSVLDTVPDAVVVIDEFGLIHSLSASAERLFGYTAAELAGRPIGMLVPHGALRENGGSLTSYLARSSRLKSAASGHVLGLRKDGTTFPMEGSVGQMLSGELHLSTAFLRDLTETLATQNRLQELQADLLHMSRLNAMGQMASTLAHELNQPLTALVLYITGCRRILEDAEGPCNANVRLGMQKAAEQALRAGQIIRRLRDFVAHGDSHQCAEDLDSLIDEASTLALIGTSLEGVTVCRTAASQPILVFVDKVQIQQVMLNLMRNALEAMQGCERRELSIATVSSANGTVDIVVADTGSGIAPEIQAKLFQPFVTSKPTGMGVGLSISRTIVEAHRGWIRDMPNPGGGTIFVVTLRIFRPEEVDDEL